MNEPNALKQKKITIRFFLHKKLEPAPVDVDAKIRKGYPLYLYITYNRKNMQFKCSNSLWYVDMEDVERQSPGLLEREEKLINRIIRYEESKLQENEEYEMRGFKDRYDLYSVSIYQVIEIFLKAKLQFEIMRTNNPLWNVLDFNPKAGLITVDALYTASQKLYDKLFEKMKPEVRQWIETYLELIPILRSKGRFDHPILLDYLDGSFNNTLSNALAKDKSLSPQSPDLILSLINKAMIHYTEKQEL